MKAILAGSGLLTGLKQHLSLWTGIVVAVPGYLILRWFGGF
jgi:hypothetical protein